ncbi:EAL domain-containing protein [Altererythrobacter lutimaris]|uniref:EAL domain-containing protein n=1 Tax=Altererythrobacter lutimaris TaxID=2743979 RepID=A0A850HAS6_9SPHN|nr:EAL domain-containing protein [Altererythrobacter lutimaris]NVE94839.1 EAL domain-containing protein [Altererythrobacter lutimaris]
MSAKKRPEKAERWEDLVGRSTRSGPWYRLRHALWAGLFAFTFLAISFFEPIDQTVWGVQARLADGKPSGQFAYVGVDRDLSDPYSSVRRVELANVLRRLDEAGVEQVYVDFVFDEAGNVESDQALAQAVAALEGRIAFVSETVQTLDGEGTVTHTIPEIRGSAPELIDPDYSGVLRLTWFIPRGEQIEGNAYETLASALLRGEADVANPIMVDYAIPIRDITTAKFTDLLNGTADETTLASLKGRKVVLGPSRANADATAHIPGIRDVPRGIVSIYAAESHLAGRDHHIPALPLTMAVLLSLILCCAIVHKKARRFGYTFIATAVPGLLIYSYFSGTRVEIAYAGFLLGVFLLFRLRFHWQRRASLLDEETGLGTLRALESKLAQNPGDGYAVVAKVHGYERVLKLLPAGLQPTYVRKIAERLKATEPELEVYTGAHYFAWHSTDTNASSLEDHLNGLRALFSTPLDIGGTPIDVGITFGTARTGQNGERALPAAMAAVEETSEAHEPVRFAVESSTDDGLWDISLRSRIDAAMNNGEVYCLYQPKYALGTESVTGVEALVRWDDHERGPIPPMVFVQESEKAGRIEQLTRYVLQSACTAGRLLHSRGHMITVSVNVSAIQCSDMAIVSTVEETLKASGFPARYLVLEVTETARIRDFSKAARVLEQLKQLGVKLSMDDFGVGMANYQTFYELPFDELKIDRLFIKDIQTDEKARAIASSLVQMGSEARITVTAEGVENPEDLTILEEIGCTQVQGYAISRPITLPNLLDFLEKRQKSIV